MENIIIRAPLKKSKVRIFIGFFLIFLLLLAFFIASFDINNSLWIIIVLLVINVFIGTKKRNTRVAYLLFNFTFFTFLIGKLFFEYLDGVRTIEYLSFETKVTLFSSIIVSLVCITVGLFLSERKYRKNNKKGQFSKIVNENSDSLNLRMLQIVTVVFYISFPFYLLTILEKAMYVSDTSYLDYYTSFKSSIPYILIKIGELNQLSFALLFCMEYRKKKLLLPLVLFIIGSVISLGIGQRNIFVLNTIMAFICLQYANKRSVHFTGKALYGKKIIIVSIIMIPIMISFLYSWGNYRQGNNTDVSLTEGVKEFFISQGGQIVFLINTIEYKEIIPSQAVPYSLSSPYNYLRNLFGLTNYGTYTKENAMKGNSLGATQFYITSPGSLLSGKGSGCCYISELYYDGGLVCVALGNILLGFVLGRLKLDEKRKAWVNAFIVLMIRWIVYIPRSSYLDWISNVFNIWNIAFVIMILMIAKLMNKKEV